MKGKTWATLGLIAIVLAGALLLTGCLDEVVGGGIENTRIYFDKDKKIWVWEVVKRKLDPGDPVGSKPMTDPKTGEILEYEVPDPGVSPDVDAEYSRMNDAIPAVSGAVVASVTDPKTGNERTEMSFESLAHLAGAANEMFSGDDGAPPVVTWSQEGSVYTLNFNLDTVAAQMMAEGGAKIPFSFAVPGQILDYSPKEGATYDAQNNALLWELDLGSPTARNIMVRWDDAAPPAAEVQPQPAAPTPALVAAPTVPQPVQPPPLATLAPVLLPTPLPVAPVEANALVVPAPPPAAPQAQSGQGRIAFASNFQGDYEIYTINPDGTDLTRLTTTSGGDWFPAWSPDGSKIAYQCNRGGSFELCLMNADGADQQQLTQYGATASVQHPTWSHDGKWIAFSLESPQAVTGIDVMEGGGGAAFRLTTGRDPSWSPDGLRVAFTTVTGRPGQVSVIAIARPEPQQLTSNAGICMYPTWSPDGTQLAYSVEGQGVHIMNADGSNDRVVSPASSWGLAWSPGGAQLALSQNGTLMVGSVSDGAVRNLMQGIQPSWSRGVETMTPAAPSPDPVQVEPQPAAPASAPVPEVPVAPTQVIPSPAAPALIVPPPPSAAPQAPSGQSRITFASNFEGDYDIYTINPDGTGLTRLTTTSGVDWFPAWSPDGSKITYQCSRAERFELCLMNADGTDQRQLTQNGGAAGALQPTWSPDSAQLAYSEAGQGIHIVNADGSNDRLISPETGWDLTWSPDGTQLALSQNRTMTIIDSNGGVVRNLIQGVQPAWSPGGRTTAPAAPAPAQPEPVAPAAVQIDLEPSVPVPPPADVQLPPQPAAPAPAQPQPAATAAVQVKIDLEPSVPVPPAAEVQPPPQPAAPPPAQVEPQPQAVAPDVTAGLSGYIVFPVYKPGMTKPTYDIYVSRPDGSDRRLLWEWGRQPEIRRGDGRVVLNSDGLGRDNLWTVNLDGSDAKESSLHAEDSHPRWSPNGDRLLFDSQFYLWNDQRQWTVWLQNSTGKGTEPVSVSVADRVVPGESPIWLDNDWVAYSGCNFWEGAGRCGLYTTPSWGDARAHRLTDQPDDRASDFHGDRIAYMSRASGNWDVWTVGFDSGGKVNLSNHPANDGLPTFSPDGSKIAFLSDREGVWAIWVMNADGSSPRKLFDIGGTMGEDWATERISWGSIE